MTQNLLLADFEGEIPWDVLIAAGYKGAAFYLQAHKGPSDAWIIEGAQRGMILLPIFEKGGHDSAAGAARGLADANEAASLLNARPILRGIPWACAESDYDADPSVVGPYYQALHARSITNGWSEIIVYAGGDVGRECKANGWAIGAWLTCSGGFHGSSDHTGIDLWQRCAHESGLVPVPGRDVDTDIMLNPSLPLWGNQPQPPPEEPVTPADIDAIANAVLAKIQQPVVQPLAELHAEYANPVDDKGQPPHGNKAWQIAKTFLAATGTKP